MSRRQGPTTAGHVTSSWNRSVRSELNRYGSLLLNARLTEHDTWGDQAVDERARWLAQRLARPRAGELVTLEAGCRGRDGLAGQAQ